MTFTSEADARINIDQLLREAGWDPADKQQVTTEVGISLDLNEISSEFSSKLTDEGPVSYSSIKADYVLRAVDGRWTSDSRTGP